MQVQQDAQRDLTSAIFVHRQQNPDQQAYALIYGVPVPALYPALVEFFRDDTYQGNDWLALVTDAREGIESAQYGAFLVRLPQASPDDALLTKLTSLCQQHPFAVAFLFSPWGLSELTQALQQRLLAIDGDRLEWRINFFDTRCLPVLAAALTPSQHQSFFSVVSEWWWLNRENQLQKIKVTEQAGADFSSPLTLSDAQMAQFTDAALVDSTLYTLARNDADLLRTFDQQTTYRIVAQALQSAPAAIRDSMLALEDLARSALFSAIEKT